MFGIGWLEIGVILLLSIMVFGPERLPRMISQAARWLQVIRNQAMNARNDLVSAASLDPGLADELRKSVTDIAELHPRKLAGSLFDFDAMANATPTATNGLDPGGTDAGSGEKARPKGSVANGSAATPPVPATSPVPAPTPVLPAAYDDVT